MHRQTRVQDLRRRAASLGASVAVHGLAVLLLTAWVHGPKPPPRKLEIEFRPAGRGPVPAPGPPRGVENPPPLRPRTSHPHARAAVHPPSPPVAPGGQLPVIPPQPDAPVDRSAPLSFREWQQSRASAFLPRGNPFGTGGTADGDPAQIGEPSRDRCEPTPGRRFDVLYLLFDSSGSMDPIRRAQALSCAHQYATAAFAAGAAVVVGNFARDTEFTGPTRSMFDVEVALRLTRDTSATILPSRELDPLLAPAADAELVIVSDGMFANSPDILAWYRSFLERNPHNRATMYTVGAPGHGESVAELQGIGMDVFLYEQIRR